MRRFMERWRMSRAGILRRVSQFAFVSLFFFLFIKTDYTGSDQLEYAVNILFRIDPLLAACTILATKVAIALLLPSLLVVVLSLILGRSFCGWICPMGSLLDFFRALVRSKAKVQKTIFPRLPYVLLVFLLVAAVCKMPLVGYLDPFSILVRGLSLAVYPAFNFGVVEFFSFTYNSAPAYINTVTEPVYAILQLTLLPAEQKLFSLAYFSGFFLLAIFLFEFYQRRFFCRNICPLGAMLGSLASCGFFHGSGGDQDCGNCKICQQSCRMGAVNEDRKISSQLCLLCMECVEKCPRSVISFGVRKPQQSVLSFSRSRRKFIGAAAGGALMPLVSGVRPLRHHPDPLLIRPPGASSEGQFLLRCVRCGQCMQVCIGNALQPTLLRAGFEGMFSPVLVARSGYCEYNCTLCGQVCPTGALQHLTVEEKVQWKIGNAHFDKNLCLPFAKATPCIVCEEHCPTSPKAIAFRDTMVQSSKGKQVKVKQPYIIDELCIGCGICENKCPLPLQAAVIVTSAGEKRKE